METWTCPHCKEKVPHSQTISSGTKGVRTQHVRSCLEAPKTISHWRVPVWGGEHCCPFRYRGCLFSHSGSTQPVRSHMKSPGCLGPGEGDTDAKIYEDMSPNSTPAEWGQYVEETFKPSHLNPQVFISFLYNVFCILKIFLNRAVLPLALGKPQQSLKRRNENL